MTNPNKNIWGPLLWSIIHILAAKYRSKSQMNLFNIIFKKYIPNLIPCNECLLHYNSFINSQTMNHNNFAYNLYVFHDQVSNKNGKNVKSNYNSYHSNYSKYGIKEVGILAEKLKKHYTNTGMINNAKFSVHLVNLLNINKFILIG